MAEQRKRYARAEQRMIQCLRRFGAKGCCRSELANCADSNNYRRGLTDVDRFHATSDLVERLDNGRYRLVDRSLDIDIKAVFDKLDYTPERGVFWKPVEVEPEPNFWFTPEPKPESELAGFFA